MRLFRTITGLEFAQGERLPWYLGRCYYKPESDYVIVAPVPLNFVVGWGYEAWWRIRRGPEGIEWRLAQARSTGFCEGLEAGETQWQLITTAPLNKSVLLWWRPVDLNKHAEAAVIGIVSTYEKDKWWNPQTGQYQGLWHVTHWMPLPAAPGGQKP